MRKFTLFLSLVSFFSGFYPSKVWTQLDQEVVRRIDSLMEHRLEKLHIPGAAVAIVRNNQIWLSKGYGLADLETGLPVKANETCFRVGSLSKLVTATAVMQLAGKGKLDMHRDIGYYLPDVDWKRNFPDTLTLHHLLTHTAGFDRSDIGDAVAIPEGLYDLRTLIAEHPTPQTTPPGLGFRYADFGIALAGLIVEVASEKPFAEFADQNIFSPLDMKLSTFQQPIPSVLEPKLAKGYFFSGGIWEPVPLDYSQVAPADALITSAEDMARFMVAHLGKGKTRLMSKKMLDQMHAQQYAACPSAYGMTYGFRETVYYGQRVLEHGGDQLGFSSYMFLVPALQLGIFVGKNVREDKLPWEILREVFDLFYPDFEHPDQELQPDRRYLQDTRKYEGTFRNIDYTRHTFEKMAYWLGFRGLFARVRSMGDGALSIDEETYVVTGPDLFTHSKLNFLTKGFRSNDQGKITHLTAGKMVFEKIPFWQKPGTLRAILVLSFLLSAWGICWPVVQKIEKEISAPVKRWRRLHFMASVGWATALIAFPIYFNSIMNRPIQFDYGPTSELMLVLSLLLFAILLSMIFPALAVVAWLRAWWNLPTRLILTFQVAVMAASVRLLEELNLVGYYF